MKKLVLVFLVCSFFQLGLSVAAYQFSPSLGNVEFKTKGWPNLVNIKGKGQGVGGILEENDGKVSGQLTFNLASLETGISLRDDHMKNKYLQVEKYPTATLTLKDVALPKDKSGEFNFTGTMELHGVSHKVSGEADLEQGSEKMKISARIPIKLTEFKIEIPSYKGITVAETVKINFETEVSQPN